MLIETKKGSKNTSHIYFNAYGGVQQLRKKLKMLDTPDFIALNTEAYKNAGQASPWAAPHSIHCILTGRMRCSVQDLYRVMILLLPGGVKAYLSPKWELL
ncbi:hypothetical protein [Chitinophaga pinensis]|uniref:Uncharacterized protein n=1 Tax=Chitinophaga pinensis TaxID=79329 RepID=A0A5C6LNB3_9BACT|nr:hypothetical protein [Chitinophaga pinensis]TWV95080.1 hypothetical protein FEF09_25115 [Chitinophaga pinensis]